MMVGDYGHMRGSLIEHIEIVMKYYRRNNQFNLGKQAFLNGLQTSGIEVNKSQHDYK